MIDLSRRRAILVVTPDFFVNALKGNDPRHYFVDRFALPEDAKCVDVGYTNSRGEIHLVLESATFNEIPPKGKPPVLPPPTPRLQPVAESEDDVAGDTAASVL